MIEEPKLIKIKIEDLKFDGDNPNVVSEKQMKAMEESIKKYGYLVPIIINKNNIVADGEHRVEIYKRLGMKEIPAYKINVSDIDRRILRQVLNKLRGEHNESLDIKEFEIIKNNDRLDILKLLLADDADKYGRIAELLKKKDELFEIPKETEFDENIPVENRCPKCGYVW